MKRGKEMGYWKWLNVALENQELLSELIILMNIYTIYLKNLSFSHRIFTQIFIFYFNKINCLQIQIRITYWINKLMLEK